MSAKRTKVDDDASLVADELESDAVMAIRAIMREATLGQSFPCAIPVVLAHQVTQIIRRGAERQLVEARKAQRVRFIAADSLDKGTMFVVLESDYRGLCQRGIDAARRDPDAVAVHGAVLDGFMRAVLPAVSDTFVRASTLSELMAMPLSECEPVLLRAFFCLLCTVRGSCAQLDEIRKSRAFLVEAVGKQRRRATRAHVQAAFARKRTLLSLEWALKDAVGAGVLQSLVQGGTTCYAVARRHV